MKTASSCLHLKVTTEGATWAWSMNFPDSLWEFVYQSQNDMHKHELGEMSCIFRKVSLISIGEFFFPPCRPKTLLSFLKLMQIYINSCCLRKCPFHSSSVLAWWYGVYCYCLSLKYTSIGKLPLMTSYPIWFSSNVLLLVKRKAKFNFYKVSTDISLQVPHCAYEK